MIYDALIIGGGPAGTTSSILLARAGWKVVLLEKVRFPRAKVCGEFISAGTLPLLDLLGIGESFRRAAGTPAREVGVFAGRHQITAPMPAEPTASFGKAISRELLDSLLMESARRSGVTILQPCTAKSLRRENWLYTCEAICDDRDQTLQSPIVIAAHGSWETGSLPTQAARHSTHDSGMLAFKARFSEGKLRPGLMSLLAFPDGYGGLVHTDGDETSLSCCITRSRLLKLRAIQPGVRAGETVLAHIL